MNAVLKPTPVIARERMKVGLIEEFLPLLREHFKEIAHFKDIVLDPDFAKYEAMDLTGRLLILTARVEGELVGYAIYFVMPALHYRRSLQAFQDVLYVAPEYRGGLLGMRLLKRSDQELKRMGVEVVRQHMKAAHSFGPLLARLGYELEDLIYVKRL